jgi:NitT/TauT family transport system substrate-binding protein
MESTTAMRTLRMLLNTFYSGPQAWFFLAEDRGYFAEAGLAIEFTEGDTAANVVPRLGRGEFDLGYGDMNALIEAAARQARPDVVAVFATFTASPYTIAVPARGDRREPRDLRGARLGAHPDDAAWLMLPEFAAACGIDPAEVAVESCADPHPRMLRAMLDEGRWDGLFGFVNTLEAGAIEAGLPAGTLRHFEYRDHVPELYGSALMARRALAEAEPAPVTAWVRAVNRAIADTIADPEAAIDAVARRNPALDRRANLARLTGTLALEMSGAAAGLGGVDPARLARAIDRIVAAKGHARRPAVDEIFDARFLPPVAERVRTASRSVDASGSPMALNDIDRAHLRRAIALSGAARDRGDQPYGALLAAPDGAVLWESGNRQVTEHDPTAHAELNLIRDAARALGPAALEGGTVYASGEPCAMCAGAIYWSGAARVVYALGAAAMHRLDPGDTELGMPDCRAVLAGAGRRVEVSGPHLEEEAAAVFNNQPGEPPCLTLVAAAPPSPPPSSRCCSPAAPRSRRPSPRTGPTARSG